MSIRLRKEIRLIRSAISGILGVSLTLRELKVHHIGQFSYTTEKALAEAKNKALALRNFSGLLCKTLILRHPFIHSQATLENAVTCAKEHPLQARVLKFSSICRSCSNLAPLSSPDT
jgi:hypothetical protein